MTFYETWILPLFLLGFAMVMVWEFHLIMGGVSIAAVVALGHRS